MTVYNGLGVGFEHGKVRLANQGRLTQMDMNMADTALTLMGAVHVAGSADELYDDLAAALMEAAFRAVAERKVFHLALSGGSTPEPFFIRLMIDPRFRGLPWGSTHLWQVDERRVEADDPASNYRMIRETLVDQVPMRKRQRHPMPAMAEDPARDYEAELARVFHLQPPRPPQSPEPPPSSAAPEDGHKAAPATTSQLVGPGAVLEPKPGSELEGWPRMDFILLGVGHDGHTASLFPGSAALQVQDRWVALNQGPGVAPPARVTLTLPMLNAGRQLAVLVTGANKAQALRKVDVQLRCDGPDPQKLPITGLSPRNGNLSWFLDAEAAGEYPLDEKQPGGEG